MITTTVATVNDDHTDLLTSATRKLAEIMCFQEVWRTDLDAVLDAAWGVHQHDATNPAKANSAVVWSRAHYQLVDDGYELGCRRDPGDAMRDRWLAWVLLEDRSTGERFYVVAGHRPPVRERDDWPEFDANSGRFVKSLAHPVIVALDANQAPPTPLIQATGLRWHGIGIDGFLVSRGITVTDLHRLPKGASDHQPVVANFTIPKETIMANRYPAASLELLGRQTEDRMTAHDIICLHTMVGSLTGTDSMFEQDGFGGTESHFGTGGAGEKVKQWQDLAFTADANLDGNPRVISIENADKGPGFTAWSGSNVPAFTSKQLDQLVDLVAWLCSKAAHSACPSTWKCHQVGIPAVMIPDSKPGRRGIGYHRQGIDGSLPDMRVAGGELWSSSRGKICPGDKRVAQIRGNLVPAVAARLKPAPVVQPTPGFDLAWEKANETAHAGSALMENHAEGTRRGEAAQKIRDLGREARTLAAEFSTEH